MKHNLDSLKTEIASHLKENGFVVFHGFSRSVDEGPEVEWDTFHYPDYKHFVAVANELGIKLMVLHHREFSSTIIDRAIDEISGSPAGVSGSAAGRAASSRTRHVRRLYLHDRDVVRFRGDCLSL